MLLLLVPLVVTAVKAGPRCGSPRFEDKMVFSVSAFHSVKTRSEIHCYDWCWAINSCSSVSFNNISRQCRLFSQSNINKNRFQDSVFEMYAAKKNPLCKPTQDPCSSHQCPEGSMCTTDSNADSSTKDGHACNPIRYQPLASCPQLEPAKDRMLTYIGNTPEGIARVTCLGSTKYTGSNKTLTCSTSGTWEPDVGICALYLWTNQRTPWTRSISRNTFVPGRCLEVLGTCPKDMWFTLNLMSSDSVLLHLTERFGQWVRNSKLLGVWGWEEKGTLVVEPFVHDKPVNLTICFVEGKLKLFARGRLFAEYQERMSSSVIDKIQLGDMNVIDKIFIRDLGSPIPRSKQTISTTTVLSDGAHMID